MQLDTHMTPTSQNCDMLISVRMFVSAVPTDSPLPAAAMLAAITAKGIAVQDSSSGGSLPLSTVGLLCTHGVCTPCISSCWCVEQRESGAVHDL